MIYKRVAARLRAQDWAAITIELGIVIVGVFIGTQVANWNEERLERREAQRMLIRLKPELDSLADFYVSMRVYYRTTRAYATTALAGWAGAPDVSDHDFVVAAYQASQIYGSATNNATWATIFGADRLRTVADPDLRKDLAYLMYVDSSLTDSTSVNTPYRQNVRRIIPVEIQDAIRAECGDRSPPDKPQLISLPETCDLQLPAPAMKEAAAALRANRQLVEDLRWHTAAAAAYLENMSGLEAATLRVRKQFDSLD